MLFDSSLYAWFFLIVFYVYWMLMHRHRAQTIWLLAASYLFYGSWNFRYLGLIVLSTLIDFYVGKKLADTEDEDNRRGLLMVSLLSNLGLLGIFKYYNFFITEVAALLNAMGMYVHPPLLDVLLPVGISFYTFQTMSYTIDVYRRQLEPERDLIRFSLFVVFFPQLVAGPIVRARDFLHQLQTPRIFDSRQHILGVYLIAVGLIKKVAIANYIAVNLVDRVFETPHIYSSLEVLYAVYGYAIQIYCDFSGYSDVAIGSALLLGFVLPDNFARPYASADIQEFWRRWHISLSTWLRDYLYISLGGNRCGERRTYFNLFITMLLGGLWHGASWNFIIWGALHGAMLGIHRKYASLTAHLPRPAWFRPLGVFATFHFVCFCWLFFRAPTLDMVWEVLVALNTLGLDAANISPGLMVAIFGTLAIHLTPVRIEHRLRDAVLRLPVPVLALLLTAIVIALSRIKGLDVVPFIYFQF
jgi:D-alanyl-lipoteichoic acid acyltransferase DltB (MBOAT superfamily)